MWAAASHSRTSTSRGQVAVATRQFEEAIAPQLHLRELQVAQLNSSVEQRTKQDSSFEEPPLPSSMASLLSLSAPIPSVARLELISGSLSSSLIIH
ncbi:hypothetical protein CDL15_Pgr023494 [Punica granatum]|uniref:Uncharacterized protein n=1 Tax=Punica granatum TaxID=22663 RepID=A0A218W7R2_PUNGR|nr:hypothetical protein CDL15_Pgr023494 [Punica granatum]